MSYLTDKEKRLLFSALSRERVICQQLDGSSSEQKNRVQLTPIVDDRFEKEIRAKTIDGFVKEALKQFTEFDLQHGYPTVADCEMILREIAEQMKEVGE